MSLELRERFRQANYQPTKHAERLEARISEKLGFRYKYETARLAIGRSLAEATLPTIARVATEERGSPIAGHTLFGDEIDVWVSAIILLSNLQITAHSEFVAIVESHWKRGAELLDEELEDASGDAHRFIRRLADLLPERSSWTVIRKGPARALELTIGQISRVVPGGELISFSINGDGQAPHIALMGRNGSGKTRTGIHIAGQIATQAAIPFLLIDPKGEFVDENGGHRLPNFFPLGIRGIEVGKQTIPLDVLSPVDMEDHSVFSAAGQLRDIISLCCDRTGDSQKELLRNVAMQVIRSGGDRSLDRIRDLYKQKLDEDGKKTDSVYSRLSELTQLRVFSPEQSPRDFFGSSWVISLKEARTEELKKLVTLLLIDSLSQHLLSLPDSSRVDGYRELRQLLIIDEAKRILSNKKYTSLADLVRQGRSKGAVVMLISQDPSDFDGASDDFMGQLGTIISFACAKTDRGIKSLEGQFGRKLRGTDFSDAQLPKFEALVKIPDRGSMKVQCWPAH
jgi:DNA sulfur modification protein DndE